MNDKTKPDPFKTCPVCLRAKTVSHGDHSLHRCKRCGGTGFVVNDSEKPKEGE